MLNAEEIFKWKTISKSGGENIRKERNQSDMINYSKSKEKKIL